MSEHDGAAELDDVAIRWVLGELEGDEARDFERRLAADPRLSAEVRALRATFDVMPLAAVTEPPPGLRDRIVTAAEARVARPPAASSRPSSATVVHLPRRVVWSRFAAALAATLALVLGLDAWRTRQELALQRAVTAVLQEPNVVRRFDLSGSGGIGRVALDLDAKKGAMVFRDLPALPAGQVYRLWAAVEDRTVYCGQFRAGAGGDAAVQFAVPVEQYAGRIGKLFVTTEPATAPETAPTGPVVMQSA